MNPALARLLGYDSPQEAIDLITNIAEQVYAKPPERDAAAKAIMEAGGHMPIKSCKELARLPSFTTALSCW